MISPSRPARRMQWRWIVLVALVILLVPVALVVVPILTHQNRGAAGQLPATEQWPLSVSGSGADGRDRSFTIESGDSGVMLDTSALLVGQKIIVHGSGYDGSRGIYVAICRIPDDVLTKPGPCVGGVPAQEQQDVEIGTVQYAPSNWINDDWAWKLFGARSYDDIEAGTFTAYLVVGEPTDDTLDCTVDACGIYTRNDHTALNDRVQDLFVPVDFS